jgi:5-formyltetrahydrofolate cyclo-ligase
MTKAHIRRLMLEKRLQLSPLEIEQKSMQIIHLIQAHPKYQQARTVGIYKSIKNELDLSALLSDNKRFFIPKVTGETMVFQEITHSTPLKLSDLGILETISDESYALPLDVLFVPALAISNKCDRIGYGKGFFDKYLKTNRPKWTIGVIYAFQSVLTFETHEEDVTLDEVILV